MDLGESPATSADGRGRAIRSAALPAIPLAGNGLPIVFFLASRLLGNSYLVLPKLLIMNLLLSLLLSLLFTSPAVLAGGGKSKSKKSTVTIEGSFSSKRGVMHHLSCYCYDGGYVTTANGDEIAICFEKNEMETAAQASEKFSCEHIKVTGVYVEKTRVPGEGDVCQGGTMRYLKVSKFECKD